MEHVVETGTRIPRPSNVDEVVEALRDGEAVLDLSGFDAIHVDAARRSVRLRPGAAEADVAAAAARHGLVVGDLVSVEVVTVDGRIVRASERENAELFAATRRGDPVGVVTGLEHRLEPWPTEEL